MFKKNLFFIIAMFCSFLLFSEEIIFEEYFIDGTMRVDYYHIGNATKEDITLDKIYKYDIWAGNYKSLFDLKQVGMYCIKIFDISSKKMIYSKSFNSYFGEYQTSGKAIKGIKRTFHESALIPYPKNNIIFTIEKRDRKNEINKIFSTIIDTKDLTIEKNIYDSDVKVFKIVKNGASNKKIDVAVIAEGYKDSEIKKFKKDLKKFANTLFSLEPYKSHKKEFNISGVFKPSVDSGSDEPSIGVFKNTAISTSFYSMGSKRYLLTEDNKSLRDIAGHIPYDTIFIMVNHYRYGGGGIYNAFSTFTSDNVWNEYLILHEFGHSFTGLADEYYLSTTAYNEFYPKGIEPVEPNITALLDPKNVKWKKMLTKGIDVPTKWDKDKYDNLSRNKKKEKDGFLKNSKYAGKVGVFEGAGYSSKGLYRPMLDCLMFSKGAKPYCKVCLKAIEENIKYYTK